MEFHLKIKIIRFYMRLSALLIFTLFLGDSAISQQSDSTYSGGHSSNIFEDDFPYLNKILDSLSRKGLDTAIFYGKNSGPKPFNNLRRSFRMVCFGGEENSTYIVNQLVQKAPNKKRKITIKSEEFSPVVFIDLLRKTSDTTIYKECRKVLKSSNKFATHGTNHYFLIKLGDQLFYRILPNFELNDEFWKNYRTLFIIASAFNNSKFE